MSILGPNEFYSCENCGHIFYKPNYTSYNFIGAKRYSDFDHHAPLVIQFPYFVKCKQCSMVSWTKNRLEELPPSDATEVKEQLKQFQPCKFLSLEECVEALQSDQVFNAEEEYDIRKLIWTTFNNRLKFGHEQFQKSGEQELWEENLIKMCKLAAIVPYDMAYDLIIHAEIHRNMGQFEAALQLLDKNEEPILQGWVDQIKEACHKKIRVVIELKDL